MKLSADVFIGLGGNLGDPRATFREAIEKIDVFAPVEKVSSLYRSKPYGFANQPDFLNAALRASTKLNPLSLFAKLQAIETDLGKTIVRANGPRAIDLDLLFFGDLVLRSDELEVPHPGIPERDFVLLPLVDLDPDFRHPILNRSAQELLDSLASRYVKGSPEPGNCLLQ